MWFKIKESIAKFFTFIKKHVSSFLLFLFTIPGLVISIFRDGKEKDSPLSSKRIALAFAIFGFFDFGNKGITESIEMSKTCADTFAAVFKCLIPLVPCLACFAVILIVILEISKIDIQNTINEFTKKG
jgi:hypothetical protein